MIHRQQVCNNIKWNNYNLYFAPNYACWTPKGRHFVEYACECLNSVVAINNLLTYAFSSTFKRAPSLYSCFWGHRTVVLQNFLSNYRYSLLRRYDTIEKTTKLNYCFPLVFVYSKVQTYTAVRLGLLLQSASDAIQTVRLCGILPWEISRNPHTGGTETSRIKVISAGISVWRDQIATRQIRQLSSCISARQQRWAINSPDFHARVERWGPPERQQKTIVFVVSGTMGNMNRIINYLFATWGSR